MTKKTKIEQTESKEGTGKTCTCQVKDFCGKKRRVG